MDNDRDHINDLFHGTILLIADASVVYCAIKLLYAGLWFLAILATIVAIRRITCNIAEVWHESY